jgi:hypothetical protein
MVDKVVGPFVGAGVRVGIFDWAQYLVRYQAIEGFEQAQDKLMKTEAEFVAIFNAKGMTKEWGEKEWKRRWSNTKDFKTDLDPDCGLPRVSMFGETKESDFLRRQKSPRCSTGRRW